MEIKGREYGRLGKLSKFEQIFYYRVKVYISTLSEPWIILIPDLSSNQLGKCCCPKSKVLVPGNTFPRSLSWKLIWASPDSLQPWHPPPPASGRVDSFFAFVCCQAPSQTNTKFKYQQVKFYFKCQAHPVSHLMLPIHLQIENPVSQYFPLVARNPFGCCFYALGDLDLGLNSWLSHLWAKTKLNKWVTW